MSVKEDKSPISFETPEFRPISPVISGACPISSVFSSGEPISFIVELSEVPFPKFKTIESDSSGFDAQEKNNNEIPATKIKYFFKELLL